MAATQETDVKTGKMTIDEGVFIHYQHYQQSATSKCVVLVHSLALDHQFWRLVAPAIARQANVICIDVRGHGQSSKPPGPYSIALFAQDIKKVVQGLGYPKAIVAGASLGGCVALQFGIDYPEMTAALALIDTTAWYGPTATEDWKKRADKAQAEGLASLVPFQTSRWFSESFRAEQPEQVQQCVESFLANDINAYGETCQALGGFNASKQCTRVTVPTAVIVGAEDYAAPVEMAQYLHDSIEGSTLTVIASACHLTPIETPEVIIDALERLLDNTGVSEG